MVFMKRGTPYKICEKCSGQYRTVGDSKLCYYCRPASPRVGVKSCSNCGKMTRMKKSDLCRECAPSELVAYKNYWTETGVFCHISKQNCDDCEVGQILGISQFDRCRQIEALGRLLRDGTPMPDELVKLATGKLRRVLGG